MKTEDFIADWCYSPSSINGTCQNIKAENGKLFSYNTCICQFTGSYYLMNCTKYSTTTSKHQTYVLRCIDPDATIDNVPRDTQDLVEYIDNL